MKKNILSMAVLLMASAAVFTACSSDDNITSEQPANPTGKYTMTINASKGGDATTRALTPGRNDADTKNVLNATWATTENIYVKKGDTWASGSLQPDANAATATLKGTLSDITIAKDDVLTLQFPKSGDISYDGQVGTLADIAANFDYATATVTVADVSATGNIIPEEATTTFTNQQAIVKFTLIDKADGTTSLNATKLVVNDGTTDYTITPASATSEIYVALPGFTGQTVTLTATVGDDTYTYETATAKTFVNGQYYEITVKMTKYVPECSYTAPTLVSGTLTYNKSAQTLVTGGSATNATIYYSTNGGSSWSTDVPTGTNAGSYTVYYKVVPADGYSGGVESTLVGSKTINKANGWVTLSPNSSSGWGWQQSTTTASASISHHGGSLSWSKAGSATDYLNVSISGNTLNLSRNNYLRHVSATVTVTSAATTNYNAASATYTCYE